MKTNQKARRVWRLRIVTICLAIAATGLFDLGAIRYCCLNLRSAQQAAQTQAQQMWTGSMPISGQFLAIR
jgi:hypothetical protein